MIRGREREAAEEILHSPVRSVESVRLAKAVIRDRGDFYERDFYCFSNFSSFRLKWKGIDFDTSEHAYHWEKFNTDQPRAKHVQSVILAVRSAHEAFKIGSDPELRGLRRKDWDSVKTHMMYQILSAKFEQHEYVRQKLKEAFDEKVHLFEGSWRDDFWGVGENGDGSDWMGSLWRTIAEEEFSR